MQTSLAQRAKDKYLFILHSSSKQSSLDFSTCFEISLWIILQWDPCSPMNQQPDVDNRTLVIDHTRNHHSLQGAHLSENYGFTFTVHSLHTCKYVEKTIQTTRQRTEGPQLMADMMGAFTF